METQGVAETGHEEEEDETVINDDDLIPDVRIQANDEEDAIDNDDIDEDMQDIIYDHMEAVEHTNVRENISKKKMIALRNYISEQQQKFMDNYLLENQLSPDEMMSPPDLHYSNTKWNALNNIVDQKLSGRQRQAYDKVISYINGSSSGQLMMFMSGEGGTGKSEVIKLIMDYTRIYFGRTYGLYGPVVALGPTGVSSNNIGGFTWQSVCKISRSSRNTRATLDSKITMGKNIEGVRLVIIDEISMISCEVLNQISVRFQDARITTVHEVEDRKRLSLLPFGGIHVLFVGDFYQLPPISSTPLYDPVPCKPDAVKGRQIWSLIEHYYELDVNYRLRTSDDGTRLLASCLSELRKGNVSKQNLAILNSKVLKVDENCLRSTIPPKSVWLSSTNAKVEELNSSGFARTVKDKRILNFVALQNMFQV